MLGIIRSPVRRVVVSEGYRRGRQLLGYRRRSPVLDRESFRALYQLLSGDQTLDQAGAPLDCGVRCGQFCCGHSNTFKYLLPGEGAFLEEAFATRGPMPWRFTRPGLFDLCEPVDVTAPCSCAPHRDLRPFNCRIFPYGPRIAGNRVVGLGKSTQRYLEPCWIATPAPRWREAGIQAWQMVLDDRDNRLLFAMFGFFWDLSQASARGETMPDPQGALAALLRQDDATLWDRVGSAFHRRQKPVE